MWPHDHVIIDSVDNSPSSEAIALQNLVAIDLTATKVLVDHLTTWSMSHVTVLVVVPHIYLTDI